MRATMSVAPPGPYGTTMRIGFVGYCACAPDRTPSKSDAASRSRFIVATLGLAAKLSEDTGTGPWRSRSAQSWHDAADCTVAQNLPIIARHPNKCAREKKHA